MVNTMNEREPLKLDADLLRYQAARFQDLLEETLQCCQTRIAFLSEKFALPQAELRCLLLFGGRRYLTSKEMAQKLDVAKSRVTKIIEGLLKKKLVESVDDPRDARVKLISLTPAGRARSGEAAAYTGALHEELLGELSPMERKTVLGGLELLRGAMEAVKKRMI